MIVFQNSLIILNYTPDTDILSVDWPDFEPYEMVELKESLNKIIEILKSYDVKNLLIDASKARINMNDKEYFAVISEFAAKLRDTRMQRVARVMSSDPERERNVNIVRQENVLSYYFQDFKSRADALRWLSSQSKKEPL
jgi:uncharacterized protein YqgV (UPF0045/DUF77 family)